MSIWAMRFHISTDRSEETEHVINRRCQPVSAVTPEVSVVSNERLLDGKLDINFVYSVIKHPTIYLNFVTVLPKLPVTRLVSNLPKKCSPKSWIRGTLEQ